MEYQKRIPFLLLLEIFLVGVVTSQKNIINLENGNYSNLLIAIDKNVSEDLKIIENIKAMFTSASQRLYLATKQQVYWGHIKILIPNTWSIRSRYPKARNESSQSANILVHDFTDDEPFVDNFAGCGEEGTLMHMTPAYILNVQYREDKFGNTDSVLVRNWGYYRWGLFKEHYDGIGGGAPAYDSPGGGTEGTRCSLKIKGNLTMPDGTTSECYSNQTGYNPDCRFVPNTEGQTATASLLFATRGAHIHSIKEFCVDDESDKDIQHNPLAPNLMNRLCGGDSAWKVMRERTTDFQKDVPPVSNTAPVFEILQLSPVRSVVLVLDISESMRGNKFNRMVAASADYIMSVIPSDSKVGIVVYETESQIRANLTDITETASRQRLVDALPLAPGHRSRVDFGILSGIEVLGSYAQGGYILLVSDGGEYHDKIPYDNITKSGVIIDTITISNSNYQAMENLSKKTSGISSICSDIGIGTCLIQAFHSISERHEVGMKTVPIQIYSSEVIIEPNGFKTIPVVIDAALGKETVFTVIWTKNQSISVVVTGPDRTKVDHNDPNRYYNNKANRIVSINLPLAQAGLWNVTIIGQRQFDLMDTASVSVTSKPTTQENSPVTVTVLVGSREVNFTETPALAIYAQVQRDYLPVLGADVTAIISFSDTSTTSITLLDNGSGSDLLKDDGTYSGFFLSFTSNGTYNVKVNVVGYDLAGDRTESEVEPSFMRTAWGGVFKVQNYTRNPDDDILRPSRIQDLVYTSFSYDNSTVTLRWTAVGDDLDKERASKYELRYSTNYYEVRNNLNTSHEVTQDQLVSGNLSLISPAGVIETVTISLTERGKEIVYYFAIRAWDEAGNGGDLSNIASLSIRYIPASVPTTAEPIPVSVPSTTEPIPTSVPTTIEPIPVSVATIKPTGPDNLALIIGLCCAVGVAIIVKAFVNNRNEQNIRKEFHLHPSLASKDEVNFKPNKMECSKRVGVEGDKLQLDTFGIKLEIPPGAIDSEAPQDIYLRVLTDTPNLGISKEEMSVCFGVQCLAPHDLVLKLPVTYTIPHCAVITRYSSVEAVLYTGEGEYSPDAEVKEQIPLTQSGIPNCTIERDLLRLQMNHFCWAFIRFKLNVFFGGKRMRCLPFAQQQLPEERTPVILRAYLYDGVKGSKEIASQEEELGFAHIHPEAEVLIRVAEVDVKMTCFIKDDPIGNHAAHTVTYDELRIGRRWTKSFNLDLSSKLDKRIVVTLTVGQTGQSLVELLCIFNFAMNSSGKLDDFEKKMTTVARNVATRVDIDNLRKALRLQPGDVQHYVNDNPNSSYMVTLSMIQDWRKKQTKATECGALKDVLEKAGQIHLANELFGT